MDDILGKVVSILLAALLFCMFPVCCMKQRQKNAVQLYLLAETTGFVDSVCDTGFLSRQMLEQFYHRVGLVPQISQIQILHETKEYVFNGERGNYQQTDTFFDQEDIWEKVDKGQLYSFAKGDFVQVLIKGKGQGQSPLPVDDRTMDISYGGVVRYEAD